MEAVRFARCLGLASYSSSINVSPALPSQGLPWMTRGLPTALRFKHGLVHPFCPRASLLPDSDAAARYGPPGRTGPRRGSPRQQRSASPLGSYHSRAIDGGRSKLR